jgi:tRNA G18 (ribose-2'-O)-methylase SpoU
MTQGKSSSVKTTSHCIVILHDIRSVINVGAIFRTCDAVGVSEIILSGTSPAPIDRFGRIRSDFAKSALGAEKTVSWKQVLDVAAIIDELKNVVKVVHFMVISVQKQVQQLQLVRKNSLCDTK